MDSASGLKGHDIGQVLNYLKAAGGGVALLLNFSPHGADFKCLVVGDPMRSLPTLNNQPV